MQDQSIYSLESYDFDLPPELIAQRPLERRDASRLLVINRKTGTIEHRKFTDLPDYFGTNDVLVANNTKVFKARLLGRRIIEKPSTTIIGGKVEFLLLKQLKPRVWEGAFHASAKHKPGIKFQVPSPNGKLVTGVLIEGASRSECGTVVAEFDQDPLEAGAGEVPLPPYIERKAEKADEMAYQTIYAKSPGSAAAPTAGLHFSQEIIDRLTEHGVTWEEVSLNVGLGTFRPVKTDDIRQHKMHEEQYEVLPAVADRLDRDVRLGKRIVAVGTTSVRTLESAWSDEKKRLLFGIGCTQIFIYPGFCFNVVNALVTNFHLPKSTLLMLVCAFAGRDLVLKAYDQAVKEKYRFFSYGDAMLII